LVQVVELIGPELDAAITLFDVAGADDAEVVDEGQFLVMPSEELLRR